MAYTITKSNGATIATVADGTVNSTATSLTLIGKNYAGYGIFLNENYLKLLENFANSTEPLAPLNGQLWFDSANRLLKVYDEVSLTWKAISTSTSGAVQPTSAITGDLWWDTTNGQLKAYSGIAWVLVGPTYTASAGQSGALVETVVDTSSGSHVVIKFYVQSLVVAIVSKDSAFTPQTAISGYTTIKPGINLVSSSVVTNAAFNGDVTNALSINGILSTQLLRNDQSGTTSGSLTINNNLGLTLGGGNNFKIDVTSANEAVNLTNTKTDKDVNWYVTPGGNATKAMSIIGQTGVINLPLTLTSTSTTTGALVVAGGVGIGGALYVANDAKLQGTTPSTSTTTGALVVTGGVGIGGAIQVGSSANVQSTTASTTTATGAIVTAGGVGIAKDLNVGGSANIRSGIASASTTTGALTVAGGVGVTGNINAGNVIATYITGTLLGSSTITTLGTLANLTVTGTTQVTNGIIYANVGTTSTSTTTGAIVVGNTAGGLGVSGNINAGGIINAAGNITSTSGSVVGANFYGNLGSATTYVTQLRATANLVSNIGSAVSGFNYLFIGNITPMANAVGNIGSLTSTFNTIFAKATTAQYADLAERYAADAVYDAGTVVELGGSQEITLATQDLSEQVFGVISTNAGFMMNEGAGTNETHPPVALAGRIPVKVVGKVTKGDRLVSAGNGHARAGLREELTPFNVIGRALEDKATDELGLIQVVVKLN